ncbi:type II secretion system protein [Shewanella halifaxensis]|uniref:type II secretion system protein n=1 Tax=Shewanella halifaxensis TaxID=271098 RepID=UPI000D599E45|nr:prepilin-type N-terminal cleavage/methylation domain-containing protein [Shewanella halifaxensis]
MCAFYISKKQQGFTLIEVLVAGFILFLVISVTTLIYRGATLSSHKAERSIYVNGLVPLIIDEIQVKVRSKGQDGTLSLAGQGSMAEVEYDWTGKVIDFLAAPPKLLAEAGISEVQNKRYKLWQINVNARYNGYERNYKYVEFSWNLKP